MESKRAVDQHVFSGAFFKMLVFLVASLMVYRCKADYLLGAGSYDITGPAADVNMMGYANPKQNAAGIHLRLRSRAFIVAEAGNDGNRIAYVSLDACMASQAVTTAVLSKLKTRYGDLYTEKNVALSGIHTHSGPGGYLQYLLYSITSLGFVKQSFDAIVDGAVASITQAHHNLKPGSIFVNEGEILDANINRSPSAYLNNPAEERKRYKYDVDKSMLLLKLVDAQHGPVGTVNWFPVHCTSMNNTNTLVSGDNKGAASRFMEDWFDHRSVKREPSANTSRVRSKTSFVAAFAQTNEGDVSPNTLGAFCGDTNLRCDFNHSTCNGSNELCIARGPGYPDHFASTEIIATRQMESAIELFANAKDLLKGPVNYRQSYVDFTNISIAAQSATTCPAAMGFSFAAGTTDGPGAFDFKQGDTDGNPFWKAVRDLLRKPTEKQVACQSPKPVLLDTGEMLFPYDWAPAILPIQILQVGQLFILSVPSEFTTMAGRRLKDAVKATLVEKSNGKYDKEVRIVISGLTNAYSSYVTTFEEYQIQRYEGASTLYGPHTLSAYIQEFKKLAEALVLDTQVAKGPSPPDLISKQISLLPEVIPDTTPAGIKFGDVSRDVARNASFRAGDSVEATFWSGSPRNNLMTEASYTMVEFQSAPGVWTPAYDDDDWSVQFVWKRPSATIKWKVPKDALAGTYRLRLFGASKALMGKIDNFTGISSEFVIV
ncbi:neutral ceramidase 2 [Selaginella moellendorffii]|nr:neutral ceramidase 2 [Selaginella moellendorffii]|eukprot:XP_002993682.2 neutral ceramidase 2 [Selaginella moellendorffii]